MKKILLVCLMLLTVSITASAQDKGFVCTGNNVNIRKGPGTDYARTQYIPRGVYTIVAVSSGKGSTAGWGKLKSGAGWISLDYVTRL